MSYLRSRCSLIVKVDRDFRCQLFPLLSCCPVLGCASDMSDLQQLRVLVTERLVSAAEEILVLVEKVLLEQQEELRRRGGGSGAPRDPETGPGSVRMFLISACQSSDRFVSVFMVKLINADLFHHCALYYDDVITHNNCSQFSLVTLKLNL